MTTTTINFTIRDLDGTVVPFTNFQIASGRLNTGEIPDVMPATVTFTTDASGQATVTLTVTEAPYYISKLDGSTNQIITYKFFVPASTAALSAELLYVDLSRRSLQWNDKSVAALIEAKVTAINAANQALAAVSILGSVSTLSANLTNIIAVGTDITNVNTVAGAVTDIDTVAGSIASVNTLSPHTANITLVADAVPELITVAGSIASVNTVAPYVANIATVAPVVADVATVAGISTAVSAVAGNATNINTVAANTTAISTVATDITSVNTVAANISDIQDAASIVTDIAAVIPYVANISTVATNITPIVAVGNNMDNINDIQALESEIQVIAANITNLSNAAAAVTQAVDAQKETYTGGVDYTINTSTALSLTYFPAKSNSVKVFFDGVYQNQDTWTRVGKTLSFNSPITSTSVEVTYEVPSSFVGLSAADTAVIEAAELSATNSAANALQWSIDSAGYASDALAAATQAVDGYKELFIAGSQYTQNTTTQLNLGATPAKVNTVKVFFNGVYQNSNTYTLAGTVLTFSDPISVATVEVQYEVPSSYVGLSAGDQAYIDAALAAAQASANAAALSFDSFDDRYLGAKTVAPTLDNDGNALITGAMYFDSTINKVFVRTSLSTWVGTDNALGVSYTPTGNIAATDVQNAITELDTEKVSITALATSTGASNVGFTPASGIAATNVQAAVVEVVTDLADTGGSALVGYDGGTVQDVLDSAKDNGNPPQQLFEIMKSSIDPERYNPPGRWNEDATTELQQAIYDAATEGRTLKLRKTYTVGPLVLYPNLRIEGDAGNAQFDAENLGAGLRTKQGATAGYLLSLYDSTNQTIWNSAGVQLYNFKILGDKGNQTNLCGGVSISHLGGVGGGSFIPRHKIDSLTILNTNGNGLDIGPYTRDSFFTNITVYGANGYGVHDAGVDGLRSNWNIGQSFCDGLRSVASAVMYSNIKSWGSGQYNLSSITNSLITNEVTGLPFDATEAVNFFFWKCAGVNVNNLKSQEAAAQGFRLEGQGINTLNGFVGTGLESDGDCRMNSVSGIRPGINITLAPGIQLQTFVGKLNAAFIGGPYNGITIGNGSEGGKISITTSGVTSYAVQPATGGYQNDWNINGHKGKTATYTGSSYTPNPFDGETHIITMNANLTVNNPGRKPVGFKLCLIIIQDAVGGRTTTFGSDFKANWSPVTTASKTNTIEFISNGTNWIQTSSAVGM